jgi:protein SCO1/2
VSTNAHARNAPISRSATRIRITRFVLIATLIAVAAIPLVALWKAFGPHTTYAPDFTLTDQDSHPFTLSGERGRPVVLFFGYTHCPDACPTTLAHLARAVRNPAVPRDVRIAFITVDPQRDSPQTLKRYVRLFNSAFVGLTGTLRALDPVYSACHTWREAWPVNHGPNDYFMAHGVTIYYIGRDGTLRGLGHWDDSVAALVHDLKGYQ